jgi:hypothetical protein
MAGYSLRLIGPLKSLKFPAFSNFTPELSNRHEPLDSMASRFMRGITKPYPRGSLYACVGKEMRLANEFCAQHDRSK